MLAFLHLAGAAPLVVSGKYWDPGNFLHVDIDRGTSRLSAGGVPRCVVVEPTQILSYTHMYSDPINEQRNAFFVLSNTQIFVVLLVPRLRCVPAECSKRISNCPVHHVGSF